MKVIKEEMESTEYLCMIFCHAIATKNKLVFDRIHNKIGQKFKLDPKDQMAAMAFNAVYGLSFSDVITIYSRNMNLLMNKGLHLSILRQRATVSFDLIAFARRNVYDLGITMFDLKQLLFFDNFQLINLLIGVHCLLYIPDEEGDKGNIKAALCQNLIIGQRLQEKEETKILLDVSERMKESIEIDEIKLLESSSKETKN